VAAVIVVAGIAVAVLLNRPTDESRLEQEDEMFPELVAAGSWLGPYVGEEHVIYDGNGVAARWAGATYRPLPIGDYEEALDEIVREGGDFAVLNEEVLRMDLPALLPLVLDKPVAWHEPRLSPAYIEASPGRNTLIFRVLRPGGPPPLRSERAIKKELAQLDHHPNHFFHGLLAMRRERWSAAAGEFALAVRADSTNTVAMNNRAWCAVQAGFGLETAEPDAREAVAREPENTDYLDTLVALLKALGKTEEAVAYEEKLNRLLGAPAGETQDRP
jgi:hypothetical protein